VKLSAETRSALDALREAAVVLEGAGQIVHVNPAFEQLFGYGLNELTGTPLARLIPGSFTASESAALLGQALSGLAIDRAGDQVSFELTLSALSSMLRLAVLRGVTVAPRCEAAAHPDADHPERGRGRALRDTKAALRRQNEITRTITENATLGLLMIDMESRCTYMNAAAERITGFTLAELQGKPLHEYVHHTRPDGRPYPFGECVVDRALPSRAREQGEEMFVRKDGSFYNVAFTASTIVERGKATGVIVEIEDITEEKRTRAERTRKAAEQRFLSQASELLLNSLDIEKTLGTVAQITVPELADWCLIELVDEARTGPDALQPVAFAHVNPERVQRVHELRKKLPPSPDQVWQRVYRTGKPLLLSSISEGALKRLSPDPATLELLRMFELKSAMIAPLKARGKVIGVISLVSEESKRRFEGPDLAFAIELAERVALAVENARLYRQAQDAVRLRDEFLSIASHELRTPLTPLQLHLQHLEKLAEASTPGLLDPKVQVSLRRTRRQVDRLIALVDSLLDVTRLQSGRLELHREQLDLVALAKEVLGRFSEESERAGSSISLHAEEETIGLWDGLRIEQVLVNLLANALKYGCSRPIEVHVSCAGELATVRVVDHGIGIESGQLERIFGRFERAVSARAYGGLGLGLYIVEQIVQAHEGAVRAESEPGGGATFVVELPRKPANPALERAEQQTDDGRELRGS
jgi:PAS domain S-box-containing protein